MSLAGRIVPPRPPRPVMRGAGRVTTVLQLAVVLWAMAGGILRIQSAGERIDGAPALFAAAAGFTAAPALLGALLLRVIVKRGGQQHLLLWALPMLVACAFTGWHLARWIDESGLSPAEERAAKVRAVLWPTGKGARPHVILDAADGKELRLGLDCFVREPQQAWAGQTVRLRVWAGSLGGRWIRHRSVEPPEGAAR
jgi:hypothetical protein